MPTWVTLLIQFLGPEVEKLIAALAEKIHAGGGKDADVATAVALAILKRTAEIQGLTIDWTDANAIAAYVQTFPDFTPIPEPPAPSAG